MACAFYCCFFLKFHVKCAAGCIFEPRARALEVKKESWHRQKHTQEEPPHGVSRENNASNKSAFSHNNQRAQTHSVSLSASLENKNFKPKETKLGLHVISFMAFSPRDRRDDSNSTFYYKG
jgi:hypothetical protein